MGDGVVRNNLSTHYVQYVVQRTQILFYVLSYLNLYSDRGSTDRIARTDEEKLCNNDYLRYAPRNAKKRRRVRRFRTHHNPARVPSVILLRSAENRVRRFDRIYLERSIAERLPTSR